MKVNIEKNGVDKLYLRFRDNISIYYFGKHYIADYNGSTIGFLDENDIKIIKLVNGYRTAEQIKEILCNNTKMKEDQIENCIQKIIKNGRVIKRKYQSESEVIYKGEKGKYFPKDILIELTNLCNFQCPFCYKEASFKGVFINDELIEKIKKIIGNNVDNILLTGGEPTLHPNIEKYIVDFSMLAKVRMNTNGSKIYELDKDILKMLKNIQITLYGTDDNEYFHTTGIKNGFSKVKKTMNFLNKWEIQNSMAITLNSETIGRLEEYVLTAINLGCKVLKIGQADLFGREKNKIITLEYEKQIENIDRNIKEMKAKYRGKIYINTNYTEYNINKIDPYFLGKFLKCGSGFERMTISQNGRIRACECFDEKIFDMGDLDDFEKFINGRMNFEKFNSAVVQMYKMCNCKIDNLPCDALREYCFNHIAT